MWRGLETRESRDLASHSIHFVPSYINSIFTVHIWILYLSCNEICKKNNVTQFNNNKKNYGNPIGMHSNAYMCNMVITLQYTLAKWNRSLLINKVCTEQTIFNNCELKWSIKHIILHTIVNHFFEIFLPFHYVKFTVSCLHWQETQKVVLVRCVA